MITRCLHGHARYRLNKLVEIEISLHDYVDINDLAEGICAAPRTARAIHRLFLARGRPLPLAFSSIPHRLARQLVNLESLYIRDIPEASNVHFSTWLLYGSAFPSVEYLKLREFQFPSFMDFLRLIGSFRALKTLELRNVSFARQRDSTRFPQFPSVTEVTLWDIEFPSFDTFLRFVASFGDLETLLLYSLAPPGIPLRFPQLPSVAELTLKDVPFSSLEDFVRFITSFRAIDNLHLYHIPDAYSGLLPIIPRIPSVVALDLSNIHFPSFEVFIRLIVSFNALEKLTLEAVSCAHPEVPPTILQPPCTPNSLECLVLRDMGNSEDYFLEHFSWWISSGGCIIQQINFTPEVGLHPSGSWLLEGIHMHVREVTLSFVPWQEYQKPLQSFLGE